ncbi:MAG: acyl-ACP--UDP-N-acetylglucosamine O-acyltransferase [Verrucomicrobia bacterium]|nr:acyl-ACP--UDP-N-acetylglucosamine O-acyltransferase [Verrucomicrobiota bacterium]
MANVHPQAIVEPGAKLGANVTVEPFAIVKSGVCLHDGVTIKSHAYLDGNTIIGANTIIYPGASIGTKTQDLKYRGETTYVNVGANCEIREFVTINSSCGEGSSVDVGEGTLIMAYCHVAHNCSVGKQVVMANAVSLAGHVVVEDFAIIGGMTGVHQGVRIGTCAMVGGISRVTHDVPPYTIGGGIPYRIGGLNTVGLQRRRFSLEKRLLLKKAFDTFYRSGLTLKEALAIMEKEENLSEEVAHWIKFCKESKRGLISLIEPGEEGASAAAV